jgi:hypothetical protein
MVSACDVMVGIGVGAGAGVLVGVVDVVCVVVLVGAGEGVGVVVVVPVGPGGWEGGRGVLRPEEKHPEAKGTANNIPMKTTNRVGDFAFLIVVLMLEYISPSKWTIMAKIGIKGGTKRTKNKITGHQKMSDQFQDGLTVSLSG